VGGSWNQPNGTALQIVAHSAILRSLTPPNSLRFTHPTSLRIPFPPCSPSQRASSCFLSWLFSFTILHPPSQCEISFANPLDSTVKGLFFSESIWVVSKQIWHDLTTQCRFVARDPHVLVELVGTGGAWQILQRSAFWLLDTMMKQQICSFIRQQMISYGADRVSQRVQESHALTMKHPNIKYTKHIQKPLWGRGFTYMYLGLLRGLVEIKLNRWRTNAPSK
jgi:hypothetical protein